jgi:hypothetical protein
LNLRGESQLLSGLPLVIGREAEPPCPVVDLHMSPYPNDAVIHNVLLLSCLIDNLSIGKEQSHKTDFLQGVEE